MNQNNQGRMQGKKDSNKGSFTTQTRADKIPKGTPKVERWTDQNREGKHQSNPTRKKKGKATKTVINTGFVKKDLQAGDAKRKSGQKVGQIIATRVKIETHSKINHGPLIISTKRKLSKPKPSRGSITNSKAPLHSVLTKGQQPIIHQKTKSTLKSRRTSAPNIKSRNGTRKLKKKSAASLPEFEENSEVDEEEKDVYGNGSDRYTTFYGQLNFLSEVSGNCYVCNSNAEYYHGGFFCKTCIKKFETIITKASTFTCPTKGKCAYKQSCDFCLPEEFYIHGIQVTDVKHFKRSSQEYISPVETTKNLPLNEEEKSFCRHFNQTLNHVLDWLWNQGDLLKLTPNDRMTLLQANAGRARLLWITADSISRHNVLKFEDGYLDIRKFTSEVIRNTIAKINEMVIFFGSLSLTPQHIYFLKLLSIFQTEYFTISSVAASFSSKGHFREDDFERGSEVKLMAEHYWKMLYDMEVREDGMKFTTDFINSMQSVQEALCEESWVEDVQFCILQWAKEHPELGRWKKVTIPISLASLSLERYEICNCMNSRCIKMISFANKHLDSCVSFRDKKMLLYHNMMPMLVTYLCWNFELLFEESEERMTDSFVKSLCTEMKVVATMLREELAPYVYLSDIQLLLLTQKFSGTTDTLRDIDINDLSNYSSSLIFEIIGRKVKGKYNMKAQQRQHLKRVEKYMEEILEKVKKLSLLLESSRNELPLFVNYKSLLMET